MGSYRTLLRKFGRLERVFLALLILAVAARFGLPGGLLDVLLTLAAEVAGLCVACRWTFRGLKRLIWRLRYRLIVTYLFIAVVPIVLIALLVWIAGGMLFTGQVVAYLATSELERRSTALYQPAMGLAWTPPEQRNGLTHWLAPYFQMHFGRVDIVVRDGANLWRFPQDSTLAPPGPGWGDTDGLVFKDGKLYLWGHAVRGSTDVTILAPVSRKMLGSLLTGMGRVAIRDVESRQVLLLSDTELSPSTGFFDREITGGAPVKVSVWERPGQAPSMALVVGTRWSALLGTLFGQRVQWGKDITTASATGTFFTVFLVLFVLVELASFFIGVRLTRTITRAVHNLYEGTQRVREGEFSHRIEISGNDQLAELGDSFNRMTENLQQLIEVAKEKERLQSEIEIAREVQNQLFPKNTPESATLHLRAACTPARLVSGDYYDYLNLDKPTIALAVGDVAGKGISAALLMATVQSTMRTQLRAGREMAAAAGNGHPLSALSTAGLVSRLNQQLYQYTPPEKFATFFFALYDDETGWLNYTNAGHLPPILVHNGEVTRLDVTGTVVGAFPFSDYTESRVKLEPGDLLLCFTDGITEPENEFGEMYGEDRLAEVVVKNSERDSAEIVGAIMDAVRNWTGSPELQDDMTLLLARRV